MEKYVNILSVLYISLSAVVFIQAEEMEILISSSGGGRLQKSVEVQADERRQKRQADDIVRGLTNEQRIGMLASHNQYRRETTPTASNMRKMVWSVELELLAQAWADECSSYHSDIEVDETEEPEFPSFGQNVFGATGSPAYTRAVNNWMNEEENYNFNTASCEQDTCGHYTQVVWDTTYAVGCGIRACPDGIEGFRAGTVIICNYGPAGNLGRAPFTAGTACADCTTDFPTCDDGLCRPSTACEGVVCENGGTLRTDCLCDCPEGETGALCQGDFPENGAPRNSQYGAPLVILSLTTILLEIFP